MSRPLFSDKEFDIVGTYPAIPAINFIDPDGIPESPVYNRPITPKENWRLILSGKKPYWIPDAGWVLTEVNEFRPRIHPDNFVNHQCFDGGPPVDYEKLGNVIHSNWYDLNWEWVPSAGGATIRPGNPKVHDINHWEKYVTSPDVDALDWKRCARENKDFLNVDKMNQLGIQISLWERLMHLMEVDKAALALIDEDQKEGVHRFLNDAADVIIRFIERVNDCCDIDCVLLHDDWGHQNGPFFSEATAREMIFPHLKRIIDKVHSLGLYYEHHSCGKVEKLIPVFIDAGVDLWCGQLINDVDMLAHQYKDKKIVFGVPYPAVNPDASEEEIDHAAKEFVEHYRGCRICTFPSKFEYIPPYMKKAVYKQSRLAFQSEEQVLTTTIPPLVFLSKTVIT